MLYSNYEAKIQKIANIKKFLLKWKYLILGITSSILAFIFIFLACIGIINKDIEIAKEEFTYGENISFSYSKAFATSTHYEYALEGSDNWVESTPVNVGSYKLRTYSYNGYKVKRYGQEYKFKIVPKEVKTTLNFSVITYGDTPKLNINLVNGDSLAEYKINYDDILSDVTNAQIDVNSLKIVNSDGEDVTSNYNFEVEEKKSVTVNNRTIVLASETKTETYNGETLKGGEVNFINGTSLASGDYFEVKPTTTASLFDVSYSTNPITPTKEELVIKNQEGVDVTSKYNIIYNEGNLKLNSRNITIVGNNISSIYNGKEQLAGEIEGYNKYSVTNLAPNDYISNIYFSYEGRLNVGNYPIEISSVEIRNRNTQQVVTHNYNISKTNGIFSITKRPLHIVPTINGLSYNNGYSKIYDGNMVNLSLTTRDGELASSDKLDLSSNYSYTTPGTYYLNNYNISYDIYNQNYSNQYVTGNYEIFFEDRVLNIEKRLIRIEVSDINLFESNVNSSHTLGRSYVLNKDMVRYSYASSNQGFVGNDKLSISNNTSKVQETLKAGTYNLLDYFNITCDNSSKYDLQIVNSPKINVSRVKLVVNYPYSVSSTYDGTEQKVSGQLEIDRNASTLPNNISSMNVNFSKTLKDVSKENFTIQDIVDNEEEIIIFNHQYIDTDGNTRTMQLNCTKDNIDFELSNTRYYEITSKEVAIKVTPPRKFYDGKAYDVSILDTCYQITSGALVSGHKIVFSPRNNIINVGTYNEEYLKNNINVRIYSGNDDVTSNYNFSVSFDELVIERVHIEFEFVVNESTNYLFYKTFNSQTVKSLGPNANDAGSSAYGKDFGTTRRIYSNVDDYYTNVIESDFLIMKGNVNGAYDVGTYDVVISSSSFKLTIDDKFNTVINDKSLVDVSLANGEGLYEVRKRNYSYTIDDLVYYYDGKSVDLSNELNISAVNNTSLASNDTLVISGKDVSEVGEYSAQDLELEVKIFNSNNQDVSNNYNITFVNEDSFNLSIRRIPVVLKQKTGINRVYDGSAITIEDFFEKVSSPVLEINDKHTYEIIFASNNTIPDEYYDVVSDYILPSKPKMQCIKDGQYIDILEEDITYEDDTICTLNTTKKDITITINDDLFYLNEDEYEVDLNKVQVTGLSSDDYLESIETDYSEFIIPISGKRIDYGVSSLSFDVNYYQAAFTPVIKSKTRNNKEVTSNYNINFTGTINYKKAKLNISVVQKQMIKFNAEEHKIGSYIDNLGDNSNNIANDSRAKVDVTYNYIDQTNNNTIIAKEYYLTRVGTVKYNISDVVVYYDNVDVSDFVDIVYDNTKTCQFSILKANLTINIGNFRIGVGNTYDFREEAPECTLDVSNAENFQIIFVDGIMEDENDIYELIDRYTIRILIEGSTTFKYGHTIKIKYIKNDISTDIDSYLDCFNITWNNGVITGVDLSISE